MGITERTAKRALILDAARRVFEADGLDGASLRAIAAEAGYTPPALYFHFTSKEDLYAAVLHASLARLGSDVAAAAATETTWAGRLHAAAMAFFGFYAKHPRDLDLGFYLLRGGMKPAGLGRARDEALNAALADALAPIADAARDAGLSAEAAELLVVDLFAHAVGLLLLAHTGRIRMFGASAEAMMDAHVRRQVGHLRDGT
ncbi:TetR/AcrR family transcriptional regulator [Acidisphaera rubrifaciens]|uniref:Transcriptional regulator TetR n=1 Tax=Acidisphaera rubrifaciens HS-AP3 TaxID=1231350 RepID=A0A0D6P476_9PROT|nr:TetR/AcrR family transcriptional regulator [Acidisphaera rubrifaciens]GAN76472.1 transcriptional regulator TetR [Acidisphaera rubrifaciens HS-AP3]